MLGGTQSLHTNSFDEAIALPTEKAARLALRTQQVLAYETDLTATVDPFAGSYAVEAMTDDDRGGRGRADARGSRTTAAAVAAIERGFQKREIERPAYRIAQEIDDGERVVVGVNRFQIAEERAVRAAAGGPGDRASSRRSGWRELRAEPGRRRGRSGRLEPSCKKPPRAPRTCSYPMREALRARATVGEVCDALREVWGVYQPPDIS